MTEHRIARSVLWMFASAGVTKGVQFITTIVVARLIGPDKFGLVVLALIVINLIKLFQESGFYQALILRHQLTDDVLSGIFSFMTCFSLLCGVLLLAGAPLIGVLFNEPRLVPLIRWLALVPPCYSFGIVPGALLERRLKFTQKALSEISTQVVYVAAAILLALAGLGAWAVIWAEIISAICLSVFQWYFSAWHVRIDFRWKVLRELTTYGKYFLGMSALSFLLSNIDHAVVGRILGSRILGVYAIAYGLGNLITVNLSRPINRVMFPVYSHSFDPVSINRKFLLVWKVVLLLSSAFCAVMVLFSREILGLYGKEWQDAVPLAGMFAVYGVTRALTGTLGTVLDGSGYPEFNFYGISLIVISLVVFLVPMTILFGSMGTAMLSVLSVIIGLGFMVYHVNKKLGVSFQQLVSSGKGPLLSTLIAYTLVVVVKYSPIAQQVSSVGVTLIAGSGLFLILASSLAFVLDRPFVIQVKAILKSS